MKLCPHCMRTFEDEACFCPLDGVSLKETKDPYIGETFIGQFDIRERCGQGSMGSVYRAWQISMEREVAIKVLRRDLLRNMTIVKRFQREARASARLSHPNIITVYLVGKADDGAPFLAMEYLTGRSLDEVCRTEAPLAPVRAIHIARQITSALAEAHGQQIIHRDLKPENIFLSNTKHTPDFVKVLDFGIAKILYENNESLLTQTGAIFGTPYYLAPEQAAGSELDHRCDLYALGVMLFLMTTGTLPFQGSSGMAVLIQHLQEQPPRPRDLVDNIPRSLEQVILKSLAKSPDDRFQSAEEMGRALEEVLPALGEGQQRIIPRPNPGDAAAQARVPIKTTPKKTSPQGIVSGPPQEQQHSPTIRGAGAPLSYTPPFDGHPPRDRITASSSSRPAESIRGPGSTQLLAQRVLQRRALISHLLLSIAVVFSGSALGAVYGWRQVRSTREVNLRSGMPAPVQKITDAATSPFSKNSDAYQSPAADQLQVGAASPSSDFLMSRELKNNGKDKPPSTRVRVLRGRKNLPARVLKGKGKGKQKTVPGSSGRFPPAGPDPALSGSDHGEETVLPLPENSTPRVESPPPPSIDKIAPMALPAPPKTAPTPPPKKGEDDSFYDMVE